MRDTTTDFNTVRDDIAALKEQLADLVKDLKAATAAKAAKLSKDIPERGAEAVRDQVRESPLAAMAISFVAGCILARMCR